MSVTSCKDDDDKSDNNGRTAEEIAQDPYDKTGETATALYRMVSQLSICDSLPNDWKTTTFEPRVGKVLDASQPRVRTITVNDAAEAVARYNSLTGKELPATTTSDTYKVDGVGTLTLTVGAASTIATIDVDVKQMPQLQQLRLVTASSIGENGSFKGEPYYHFGDVVMDKKGHYWICIRPAYSPDGKEDTHWMSFQMDDNDNIKTYTKSKCQTQLYAINQGVDKSKMQYLAQLLAILARPSGYKTLTGIQGSYFDGKGLGGLQEAAMTADMLETQARLWDQYDVWSKVMPNGYDEFNPLDVQKFKERFKKDVTFIYECSTSGKTLNVNTATYTGADYYYKNMPTYAKVPVDMQNMAFRVTFNYTSTGQRGDNNYPVPDAFVVRYKTGFKLSSNWVFNPSATEAIPGVTEVFRYSAQKDNVSFTAEEAKPRMIMAKDGKFYTSEEGCKAAGTEPVALVVYIGNDADASGNYHGLAKSYERLTEVSWDETDARKEVCIENTRKNEQTWANQKDGVSRTKKLYEDGHNHAAAKSAWEFSVKGFDPAAYGYSHWFMPTVGQMLMAVKGLGGTAEYDEQYKGWKCTLNVQELDKDLKKAGVNTFNLNIYTWTSTEADNSNAVYFGMDLNNSVKPLIHTKEFRQNVHPFIAF